MKKEKKYIFYDIDFILAPAGWLEARLENLYSDGFHIWRDEPKLAWIAAKN